MIETAKKKRKKKKKGRSCFVSFLKIAASLSGLDRAGELFTSHDGPSADLLINRTAITAHP